MPTGYSVSIIRAAVRDLAAVPLDTRTRIAAAIDALAHNQSPPGVKRVQGTRSFQRIRVGDYRVIYRTFTRQCVVEVVMVGHRSDVYKRFERWLG